MPLAIELAAARIKILSPDAILSRLDHQLDVLAAGSRDLPARQQTLRGAIAWSYDLLDPGGRRLLDRLSVFATGCDLASAEAICGPSAELDGTDILDGLMALVDQSLVKVEEMADGEPRFRLLDTIRAYAAEQLEASGELSLIQERHRDWYVALVERAAGELSGPSSSEAGSTGSRSSTTISVRSSIARSRRRTRRSRSALPSTSGASGRSTGTSPRHAGVSRRWRPRRGRATIPASGRSSSRPSAAPIGGWASSSGCPPAIKKPSNSGWPTGPRPRSPTPTTTRRSSPPFPT